MSHKTFTGVDFSREIFFSPHSCVMCCVAFLRRGAYGSESLHGMRPAQRVGAHKEDSGCQEQEEKFYGTDIYEGKKYSAIGIVNVAPHGDLHGSQFSVQYY